MPKIIGGSLEEHREQTRIKLFSALATLMLERGFDALTMADIAARAGVGRTAVYNHFPDKEALLLAYMTYETEEYVATLQDALHGIEDPVEHLRTYIRRTAQLKLVYQAAPGPELRTVVSPATRARMREHGMLVRAVLEQIVARGMADGSFAQAPLGATVSMVNACLAPRDIAGGNPETVQAAEEFVLRALGAGVPALRP
ncbi:MAG TPA: TetR/AcrR family transcriptional regulator [Actinotalea sp.]|nr:TetR/AcrR family transcriptional regulator [Actinotalea sp.]